MTSFTYNMALDLRLPQKFTDREAQQIRAFLHRLASEEGNTRAFESADELRTADDVFLRAHDTVVPVSHVALAIDQGAQKKAIADQLRSACKVDDVPAAYHRSLSAHKFFRIDIQYANMVRDRMFVNPDPWMSALGVTSMEADVVRAKGHSGMRDLFWKWLNAGHAMKEFIDILRQTNEAILANKLGLAKYLGGGSFPSELAYTSKVNAEPPLSSGSLNAAECAFGESDDVEEDNQREPTLGELARANTDKGFVQFCMYLDEQRRWFHWLEAENLARGASADKFVASIDAALKRDPHHCATLHIVRELCKLPKWSAMARSDFIARLQTVNDSEIKAAGENWSAHIAHVINANDVTPIDYEREEFGIRRDLRDFFEKNSIFSGRDALAKAESAIDKLTSDDVGVAELGDLKDVKREEYRHQFGFNISEARKMETAVNKLSL